MVAGMMGFGGFGLPGKTEKKRVKGGERERERKREEKENEGEGFLSLEEWSLKMND